MASPFLAWFFRMAKMMSCLRWRAVPSRLKVMAMSASSWADFFLSSVRFMGGAVVTDRGQRADHGSADAECGSATGSEAEKVSVWGIFIVEDGGWDCHRCSK